MAPSRRGVFVSLVASGLLARTQGDFQDTPIPGEPPNSRRKVPIPDEERDRKLPNGKSQNDAIAQEEHKRSLQEAQQLVTLAQEIKSELEKAGSYVVPLSTVKKTEEIEKLAKHIRSRLKA
jgi:hypothetical protein